MTRDERRKTKLKTILHLCADTGSDSWPYQVDPDYHVIRIGKDIGVENYCPPQEVHGIIANPVCTEFSTARQGGKARSPENGMALVNECLRIIDASSPVWWVIENPATGRLRDFLGKPDWTYQPYEYGSPWTKKTALWGVFNPPPKLYKTFEEVPNKIDSFWKRPGRKPALSVEHKSMVHRIKEFAPFVDSVHTDADLRSLCSQKFAQQFKKANP
jgi:hypothetical protein